jgi:glutathione S-transferase
MKVRGVEVQLYYSPNSPYARKARIIIHELALTSRVKETIISLPADAKFRAINPLGKIPALVLDDGSVIYDSPVICEYLDDLGGGKFFPRATLLKSAEGRWRALTLQALGDGLADAVVRRNQEMRLTEDKRSAETIQRQTAAIEGAFSVANRAAPKFPEHPSIGEIAIACAIGYLDLRVPNDGWRDRYSELARWLETFSRYPSVQATRPPPA